MAAQLLKNGTDLVAESGMPYHVVKMLGAGGQGEVYIVESGGERYALKWYYLRTATESQKDILDRLIRMGSPDENFLWPVDMVFNGFGESFGYIMRLRPSNYKSITDLMKRRVNPTFRTLCRVAYNVSRAFERLHTAGYAYRDISFGNLFFDPDTGDVLICDNDNVEPPDGSNAAINGTPRFMAPEIVRGEARPSTETDLFSLAVLLFYMLMLGHPLEGRREARYVSLDAPAMDRLYGTEPLFIYDPEDTGNRPVPGYQDNVIIYWRLYPQALKDVFTRSFTVGLKDPRQRVTERELMQVFADMITGIISCPACNAQVFFDSEKKLQGKALSCWNCQGRVPFPPMLTVKRTKSHMLLVPEGKLYDRQIRPGSQDMDTVVGAIVRNPKNPARMGIRNMTSVEWTRIGSDGTRKAVAHGGVAAAARGIRIDFGGAEGEFEV